MRSVAPSDNSCAVDRLRTLDCITAVLAPIIVRLNVSPEVCVKDRCIIALHSLEVVLEETLVVELLLTLMTNMEVGTFIRVARLFTNICGVTPVANVTRKVIGAVDDVLLTFVAFMFKMPMLQALK